MSHCKSSIGISCIGKFTTLFSYVFVPARREPSGKPSTCSNMIGPQGRLSPSTFSKVLKCDVFSTSINQAQKYVSKRIAMSTTIVQWPGDTSTNDACSCSVLSPDSPLGLPPLPSSNFSLLLSENDEALEPSRIRGVIHSSFIRCAPGVALGKTRVRIEAQEWSFDQSILLSDVPGLHEKGTGGAGCLQPPTRRLQSGEV